MTPDSSSFFRLKRFLLLPLLALALTATWLAAPRAMAQEPLTIRIAYITQKERPRVPLSLVEITPEDEGLAGARSAIKDNNTTGAFLKQSYELTEVVVPVEGDLKAAMEEQLADGVRLFLADLPAEQVLMLADLPGAEEALVFNTRAPDNRLRGEDCRANLLHTALSRAQKTDALAQYMLWKKWREWVLLHGRTEGDLAYAESLRNSARKFSLEIVEERQFEGDAPSARTDTGHVQIQKQIPAFTQGLEDHDIIMVADEADVFGEYLLYRTAGPSLVAGTQGLVPTAWHPAHEAWGGTQMQNRFEDFADRQMLERDHTNWVAVRAIGEAVTRTSKADVPTLRDYLLGEDFKVAAFKGEGLTFRTWNGQLRQPVLLVQPRALISVSPQEGFLHQVSMLDTLGIDQPESTCQAFAQ